MNKPIRTISIFCLLLFLALMVNATYLQYWKAGKLNDDPRNRNFTTAEQRFRYQTLTVVIPLINAIWART